MPTEIIMPKVDMVMETGTFVEWLKKEGETVKKDEALFVILTDKASIECEAPASGILAGLTAKPDDVIKISEIIGYILAPGETLPDKAPPPAAVKTAAAPEKTGKAATEKPGVGPVPTAGGEKLLRATPLARTLAREMGIDLNIVSGRGPGGRFYRADVLAVSKMSTAGDEHFASATTPSANLTAAPLSAAGILFPNARVRERIPLKGARAIIAQRMSSSWAAIPHIYETIVINAAEMMHLREQCADQVLKDTGFKLTYTAILAFAVSRVLKMHPYLNSSLAGEEIVHWEDVNLGIATDLGDNLVVPVVRRAQEKNLWGIAGEIGRLVEAVRSRKMNPDELRNGTFTITNLGMFGIDTFTAIINPPEAAILGVGRIKEKRKTMKLVLGADHRIVDGARVARFLVDLKSALENPYLLFYQTLP
jgi:pyruvate dehydrogenase E2 component (dihydrolipoamide acetyltransferase)